jgi:hypothetical protein
MIRSTLCILAGLVGAVGSPVLADQISNIDQMEVSCYNAAINKDKSGLDLCLAPEFTYNAPDGSTKNKEEYLSAIIQEKSTRFERHSVSIDASAKTAYSHGTSSMSKQVDGLEDTQKIHYLNAWILRNGRWQLVARQEVVIEQ